VLVHEFFLIFDALFFAQSGGVVTELTGLLGQDDDRHSVSSLQIFYP
jgi:hypothetical protein